MLLCLGPFSNYFVALLAYLIIFLIDPHTYSSKIQLCFIRILILFLSQKQKFPVRSRLTPKLTFFDMILNNTTQAPAQLVFLIPTVYN